MLTGLGGGCRLPVGAYARSAGNGDALTLTGMVSDPSGRRLVRASVTAAVSSTAAAEELGQVLSTRLREQGCGQILDDIVGQP